ncbi:MAG TPA: sugar phosphate nucleotidyltransferase [Candidatus Saccharimonadales bacterium]|jgi:UTP--glucose-1-phosphate uridylyltransferase
MAKVTKAVIAAAGFGTRFLPQTKAMPKEMLPLVDKPIIQYIVEDLVAAGIKDIIIVGSSNKRAIEDHFDMPSQDLLANLIAGGESKKHYIEEIEAIAGLANFIYLRQKGPYGNATPLLNSAHLIGDEPFIYTYADDFFRASPSRFTQLINLYDELQGSVLSCIRVEKDEDYERYGIVAGESVDGHDGILKMSQIIEKPGKDNAPSDLASVSSYLLVPEIFPYLEKAAANYDGKIELQIQPAMQAMMADGHPFYGYEVQNGTYYDTGNKLEYIKTVIDFALERPDMQDDIMAYLRSKM